MTLSAMRQCPRCGEVKPIEDFLQRGDRAGRLIYGGYCSPCRTDYQAAYRAANSVRLAAHKRAAAAQARLDGLAAMGARCNCCGETEPAFLTLDHVDGREDGDRETGAKAWLRAARRHWRGYQILCWNCNAAKHFQGVCPHQAGADL